MRKWYSIRKYSQDYLNLVYKYYAAAGISYVCTYYKFDIANSTIDKDQLEGGAYTPTGDLSGNKWVKILFFPAYNIEQINVGFTADERGFGKFDQVSAFNFPTIYGLIPGVHDMVLFDEIGLNKDFSESQGPLYQVRNVEKATNTEITFWRVNLGVFDKRKNDIEENTHDVYTFFDYEKKIYRAEDARTMLTLMEKSNKLPINNYYIQNCGFYFDPVKA